MTGVFKINLRKAMLCLWALVLVLFHVPAFAAPYAIQERWYCRHSGEALYPEGAPLHFTYHPATRKFDGSALLALIRKAEQSDNSRDYFKCFAKLISGVIDQMSHQLSHEAGGVGYSMAHRVVGPVALEVVEYGRKAFDRGAVTPVSPARAVAVGRRWDPDGRKLRQNCFAMTEEYLDIEFLKKLRGVVDGIPDSCRQSITESYGRLLLDQLPDRKQCDKNPVVCHTRKVEVEQALWYLSEAGLTEYDPYLNRKSDLDACFVARWLYSDRSLEMLGSFVEGLKKRERCRKPSAPGQSSVVSGDMGTGLPAAYTMRRAQDRRMKNGKMVPVYQAIVDIRFRNARGEFDPGLQRRYEDFAKTCYKSKAGRLRGPKGEILELRFADEVPEAPRPPVSIVSIADSSDVRANEELWKPLLDCKDSSDNLCRAESALKSLQCSLVIHETMHLLGVVDEYPERQIGKKIVVGDLAAGMPSGYIDVSTGATHVAWDCRVAGPTDSVMFDQSELLADDSLSLVQMKISGRSSVLYPAQFRAITEPGCASNRIYYACASQAYLSSRGALGNGCAKILPRQCSNPQEWMK